jgi:methyl-accepting chemotaxis protein
MPSEPRKDPLVGLLRRTANEVQGSEERGADSGALWGAHERALVRARDAGSAAQRIASTAARQRSAMDAVADRTRALTSRSQELEALTARSLDAFERLGLVALNAGLEAARRGEAEGRSLSLVGEEVRALAARGIDAARELGGSLTHLAMDLQQLDAQVGQAHAVLTEVAQDSARAAGAASDAEGALVDMGERVKHLTGTDPEAVRAVAEAGERARGLVSTLANLRDRVAPELLVRALSPMLEPLARLLAEDQEERQAEGDLPPR